MKATYKSDRFNCYDQKQSFVSAKIKIMTIYHRSPVNVNSKIVKFFNVACQVFLLETKTARKL
jgi:hypothetical protein